MIDIGEGPQEPEPRLHTVSIRPDEGEFDLIWRGSVSYPGYEWLPNMTRLRADVG